MAELEDVTLDGKPLNSLRVADLKTALEKRGLPKSGAKNALIKRLKGVSLDTMLSFRKKSSSRSLSEIGQASVGICEKPLHNNIAYYVLGSAGPTPNTPINRGSKYCATLFTS